MKKDRAHPHLLALQSGDRHHTVVRPNMPNSRWRLPGHHLLTLPLLLLLLLLPLLLLLLCSL
jgi:hypothetical protein